MFIQEYDFEIKKEPSDREKDLYWQYKNELWEISKESGFSRRVVDEWYEEILNSKVYILRLYAEGNKQIGFMFIGTGENCHRDTDYYIWDCFIVPEYRRKGLMAEVFGKFSVSHRGSTYSLYLIDENEPAVKFWKSRFEMLGYDEMPLDDYMGMETDHCHLHGYKPGDV